LLPTRLLLSGHVQCAVRVVPRLVEPCGEEVDRDEPLGKLALEAARASLDGVTDRLLEEGDSFGETSGARVCLTQQPRDIQPPVHVVGGATKSQARLKDRDGRLNIPLDEMQVTEGPVRREW